MRKKTIVEFIDLNCECGGEFRTLACEDCETKGITCKATVCVICGEPGPELVEENYPELNEGK